LTQSVLRLSLTPAEHPRIVPADELWQYAWKNEKPLNTESLHVYIYRLCNKLVPYDLSIDTMVNVGYRLVLSRAAQK
jgi:DNA-binding response OmpR family regulator